MFVFVCRAGIGRSARRICPLRSSSWCDPTLNAHARFETLRACFSAVAALFTTSSCSQAKWLPRCVSLHRFDLTSFKVLHSDSSAERGPHRTPPPARRAPATSPASAAPPPSRRLALWARSSSRVRFPPSCNLPRPSRSCASHNHQLLLSEHVVFVCMLREELPRPAETARMIRRSRGRCAGTGNGGDEDGWLAPAGASGAASGSSAGGASKMDEDIPSLDDAGRGGAGGGALVAISHFQLQIAHVTHLSTFSCKTPSPHSRRSRRDGRRRRRRPGYG